MTGPSALSLIAVNVQLAVTRGSSLTLVQLVASFAGYDTTRVLHYCVVLPEVLVRMYALECAQDVRSFISHFGFRYTLCTVAMRHRTCTQLLYIKYLTDICMQTGTCSRGDLCPYAHGVFECWLHPSKYKTQVCVRIYILYGMLSRDSMYMFCKLELACYKRSAAAKMPAQRQQHKRGSTARYSQLH